MAKLTKLLNTTKYLLSIFAFLISNPSLAQDIHYIGGLIEEKSSNTIAEAGLISETKNNAFTQMSLMLFRHKGNNYKGVNFSINRSIGHNLKAYSGAGIFWGNHENCEFLREKQAETCDAGYTAGVYPEVGFIITIRKMSIGAYGRYYITFESGENEYNMYGLRIGYAF